MLCHSELVEVKRVPGKGRGVFARHRIPKGSLIERVPVILLPIREMGRPETTLGRFCFLRSRSTVAVALGYGSLYNHSYSPNARYDEEPGARMTFTALRAIRPGEEVTINYNGEPKDRAPVGFKVM